MYCLYVLLSCSIVLDEWNLPHVTLRDKETEVCGRAIRHSESSRTKTCYSILYTYSCLECFPKLCRCSSCRHLYVMCTFRVLCGTIHFHNPLAVPAEPLGTTPCCTLPRDKGDTFQAGAQKAFSRCHGKVGTFPPCVGI